MRVHNSTKYTIKDKMVLSIIINNFVCLTIHLVTVTALLIKFICSHVSRCCYCVQSLTDSLLFRFACKTQQSIFYHRPTRQQVQPATLCGTGETNSRCSFDTTFESDSRFRHFKIYCRKQSSPQNASQFSPNVGTRSMPGREWHHDDDMSSTQHITQSDIF